MPSGTPRKASCILVVDDEEDIRATVKELLEACVEGARVRTAESGKDGLDVLRQEAGGVDLIITDYRMPGMDGMEFLRQAGQVSPNTPSFMVTAFDMDSKTTPNGSRILHKPLQPDTFVGMVEAALAA